MANPRYGQVAPSRGSDQRTPTDAYKPFKASVNVRQAFTAGQLPGKASHGFAAAKAGYREVNGYAAYVGLSASKNFIKGAIKHPGALTKKASRAGESPMEYAHEHMHDSGKTGKQARLAVTLRKLAK